MARVICLAVVLAGLVPVAAVAEAPVAAVAEAPVETIQVYYHSGNWDAFSGRSGNAAVCGFGTSNASDGRALAVRMDVPGTTVTFTASKPGWSIPDGTHIRVVMQIGLDTPVTEAAVGKDASVTWTMGAAALAGFQARFGAASSMTLTFPDGNEPPWRLSLNGSSAVTGTFNRCVADLTQQMKSAASAGSSPAAVPSGQATQPFGAGHP
jgi:hypothetical protein